MMKNLYNIVALLCLFTAGASAQEASFVASADRTQAAVGDQIEVTFTLNGSSGAKNFRAPAFRDFDVASGPNQSTNMQFINGAMSSSVSYGYVIVPRAEGKFTIGPAAIEYNGKTLQTQPITVTVTKGAPPQHRNRRNDCIHLGSLRITNRAASARTKSAAVRSASGSAWTRRRL